MDEATVMVPYLQFRANSVISYSLPERRNTPPPPKTTKTYTGLMTQSAMKRIRKTCDILVQRSPVKHVWNPISRQPIKFRLTFVTLTLSTTDLIAAPDAYTLGLAPLLRWMRKYHRVQDYIWKLELQQRGQVHYHITTNQFIRWDELRDEWNYIQQVAGWMDNFKQRHGHTNPNSTDIHAVTKVDRIDLYLAKYLAKGVGGQAIKGKVWGCSKSLSGKKLFTVVDCGETGANVYESAMRPGVVKRKLDHAVVLEISEPHKLLGTADAAAYKVWLR